MATLLAVMTLALVQAVLQALALALALVKEHRRASWILYGRLCLSLPLLPVVPFASRPHDGLVAVVVVSAVTTPPETTVVIGQGVGTHLVRLRHAYGLHEPREKHRQHQR